MKILSLHSDYIKFQAKKIAIKDAEKTTDKEIEVKEPLIILTAVEKEDTNIEKISERLVNEIKEIAKQVKAENIVLYPYAHLSSNLASPKVALEVLKTAEKLLSKDFKVTRAPFGYYKSFETRVKGHPLSELSRSFKAEEAEEKYDYKQLLKEISKTKLDRSKLKENDHRIIGKNMDLFSFSEVAPGMVFWHHKGLIIKNQLIEYWREQHNKGGYLEVSTPMIMDKKLWQISGHWEKYRENIFLTDYEKRNFAVKPMNCPGGILLYKLEPKSYKDLPLKVAELGIVHRQELSGVLGGLFRVIQFTQDDAHIYCLDEKSEILTQNGWKNMNEIKLGEIAVSYNKEKDICELKPILKIIKYNYSGEMYRLRNNDGLDCLITPEHRVLCKIRTTFKNRIQGLSNWKFIRAEELPTGIYIPTPKKIETISKCNIDDELISILGWVITDGYKKDQKYIEISQATTNPNKPHLYKKMIETIKKRFPKFKIYLKKKRKGHKESANFYLGIKASKEIKDWLNNDIHRIPRTLLETCSSNQLEKLFESLIEGDGTTTKNSKNGYKQIRFYPGYNEGLADDFQELCTRLGISSTKIYIPQNNQIFILVSLKRDKHYARKILKENYYGKVWDITIDGGAFVARRNGKTFITGNCTEEQIEGEVKKISNLTEKIYGTFGLKYNIELSTRPEKRIGTDKTWDKAESALENVLKKKKIKFKTNKGDGAFYGPKIDFHIKDSLNRTWQCGTIQVDFSMPERFDLTYEKDDKKHRPVIIHRTIYGSLERFIGILLENFSGKLPLWLNPNQIKIVTITERNKDFANKVFEKLKDENLRVEIDDRNETINKKVRDAQMQRYNYIITIGDKESEKKNLAIRTRDNKVKFDVDMEDFIKQIKKENNERSL